MASIAPARLAALTRLRCSIFQTSYNPTSQRTGAKYFRARLRGPSMVRYYPQEVNIASIISQYPEMEIVNKAEVQRLQDIEAKKRRGKGAPKKAKSKGMCFHHRSYTYWCCCWSRLLQMKVAERAERDNKTVLWYIHSKERHGWVWMKSGCRPWTAAIASSDHCASVHVS